MGIFKELIKDIKSQDTDTIQLIEDAADYVYNQHSKDFDSGLFSNVDPEIKRELIHGYMVRYMFKKATLKLHPSGTREHVEIRIISITNALTDEVVDKTSISKMIENTLIRKIQS